MENKKLIKCLRKIAKILFIRISFYLLWLSISNEPMTIFDHLEIEIQFISRDAYSQLDSDSPSTQVCSSKRTNFDSSFHRRLEQYFPGFPERMAFQKKQEKSYRSAMQKKKEVQRLRSIEDPQLFSKEELDAMDYFNGTGFYAKYQDKATKPNMFDTRQSFLRKMHDPIVLNNFLDSFNRKNN